jgi:hypothetical protein
MRSITRMFSAFGTLADCVLALAGVVDVVTGRLRQQFALDEALPTVLEHQPAGGENAALDGSSNGTAKSRKRAGAV